MTITSTVARNDYTGSGGTGPYAYTFKVFAYSQLVVYVTDLSGNITTLAWGAGFSATGAQNAAGGTVTLTSAVTTGYAISIQRNVALTQLYDFRNQGEFFPATYEDAQDYGRMVDQELAAAQARMFQLPAASAISPIIGALTAGDYLRVNLAGTGIEAVSTVVAAQNFLQSGTGAVTRSANAKMGETVSVKDFGAKGDGTTDDTAAIQAAITAVAAATTITTETVNSVSAGVTGTGPRLLFPKGRYKISSPLSCPAYFDVQGEDSVIVTTSLTTDIFASTNAIIWKVSRLTFVGGRHHINIGNANIDRTLYDFERCDFELSQDFAITTVPTTGSHLSANLTVRKSKFDTCAKVINNCCDMCTVEDTWVYVSNTNFSASTAAFVNSGSDGHPRMFFNRMFGVPTMGTGGGRLSDVRWVDNYGDFAAVDSRFGGEDGGMCPLYHNIAPPTTYPYTGYSVSFERCWLFCGPNAGADSGAITLNGQVPQRITIRDCLGPIQGAYVMNPTSIDFAAYFAAFTTAAGNPAYLVFTIDIDDNSSWAPDLNSERLPLGLRPYVSKFKQTSVTKTGSTSLTGGYVDNIVTFTALVADNVGGWVSGNPTQLLVPLGATKVRINAYARIDGTFSGGNLALLILDSSGNIIAEQGAKYAAPSTQNIGIQLEADCGVDQNTYFQVSVRTDAGTAPLTLCNATVTSLDFVR